MASTLDTYNVVRTLGKGYTAKVKLVQDPETEAVYAAKIMMPNSDQQRASFLDLMNREVAILQTLSHPNIIHVANVSENGTYTRKHGRGQYSCMYILMEFCPNGELFDMLFNCGAFPEDIARFYFRQIVDALDHCHQAGICHRDLKPENMLFAALFDLKLTDFGFSKPLATADGSGMLRTRLGTESYMAPEVFAGRPYRGEAADIFSAGVILFIMMAQNPPFGRASSNDGFFRLLQMRPNDFWRRHSANRAPGYFSDEFKDLLQKMLAEKPENRIGMQEIREHPWFNGPIGQADYIQQTVVQRRQRTLELAEQERQRRQQQGGNLVSQNGHFFRSKDEGDAALTLSFGLREEELIVPQLDESKYNPHKFSTLKTGLRPTEVMKIVSHCLEPYDATPQVDPAQCKVTVDIVTNTSEFKLVARCFGTDDDMCVLDMDIVEGDRFQLMKVFREIYDIIQTVQAGDE